MSKKRKVYWNYDIRINKYFWGVVLLFIAAAILIDSLGVAPEFFENMGVWRILLILVMACWIIKCLLHLDFGSIVIPLALVFMATKHMIANAVGIQSIEDISNGTIVLFACVFICGSICLDGIFGKLVLVLAFAVALLKSWLADVISLPQLSELSNWTIFICGLLLAVGINIIIPTKNKSRSVRFFGKKDNGDTSSLGSKVRYIDCNDLTEAYAKNSFGEYEIFFQNINDYKGDAVLNVENHFGEMVINVPDTWRLEARVNNSFGECDIPAGNEDGKVLRIEGINKFGELRVHQSHYTDNCEYGTDDAAATVNINGKKSEIISKYINCESFTYETIHNDVGAYAVYFSNIDMYREGATLCIENRIGAVTVYVPMEWRVNENISNKLGTCSCECKKDADGPLLNVVGENKLGEVKIVYHNYD